MRGLTVKDYAAKVQKNIATIYRWIDSGKLDYYREGKTIMILGEKKENVCEWRVNFPGEPAQHLVSGCGHYKYFVTDDVKTYKFCPHCGSKIDLSKYLEVLKK